MCYFSVEEAEALIPQLTEVMSRVKKLKEKAQAKVEIFQRLSKSKKSDPVELALSRSQAEFLVSQINAELEKLLQLGCIPKGVDPYLVDFPHVLEGKEVNLCWKLGEKRITHYHGLEEGYKGRKPLPSRKGSKSN